MKESEIVCVCVCVCVCVWLALEEALAEVAVATTRQDHAVLVHKVLHTSSEEGPLAVHRSPLLLHLVRLQREHLRYGLRQT